MSSKSFVWVRSYQWISTYKWFEWFVCKPKWSSYKWTMSSNSLTINYFMSSEDLEYNKLNWSLYDTFILLLHPCWSVNASVPIHFECLGNSIENSLPNFTFCVWWKKKPDKFDMTILILCLTTPSFHLWVAFNASLLDLYSLLSTIAHHSLTFFNPLQNSLSFPQTVF